jgi:molybdopterin adenylyltransferase
MEGKKMKIGYISFSDSSRSAAHNDNFHAEIERVIASIFSEPSIFVPTVVPNEKKEIAAAIIRLCDTEKCPLVLTLGGAGPALKDIVPDVTLEVVDRKLPGFGEIMRYYSYERFKVSVLSRAEAGVRGESLVINLPARPKPVKFCLRLLQEGIVEALDQIAGIKPGLRGDEVVVPIDKYLPFLKKIRPKPEPGGDQHPLIK